MTDEADDKKNDLRNAYSDEEWEETAPWIAKTNEALGVPEDSHKVAIEMLFEANKDLPDHVLAGMVKTVIGFGVSANLVPQQILIKIHPWLLAHKPRGIWLRP